MMGTSYMWWEDVDVHFVLDQHIKLDFYNVSSLKQQSVGKHVTLLWNILSWIGANQSLLLLLSAVCFTEK